MKTHSTSISDGSIAVFNKMEALREVYLWNTQISANGLKDLKSENPMLRIEEGIAKELRNSFVVSDSLKER
ncbi:MAG: hypothetical protein ACJA1P_002417 [Maribacter sp.]